MTNVGPRKGRGNGGLWAARKTRTGFPSPPTSPWKSRSDFHIPAASKIPAASLISGLENAARITSSTMSVLGKLSLTLTRR